MTLLNDILIAKNDISLDLTYRMPVYASLRI